MNRALPAHVLALGAPCLLIGGAPAAAVSAFDSYNQAVESRFEHQHRLPKDGADERLRQRDLLIERLTPSADADRSGTLLHHWRGRAFAPGVQAADFERLLRDFNSYPQYFSPQVVQARLLKQEGDHIQARVRVRQRHVITVELDITCDVTFGRPDAQHGYSLSHSIEIAEIGSPGAEEHGFLWRLNTFWSYEERDGGLYLQIETVSLTRSIPRGLGWAIRPYVESIPRASLEFTLRSARNALRNPERTPE